MVTTGDYPRPCPAMDEYTKMIQTEWKERPSMAITDMQPACLRCCGDAWAKGCLSPYTWYSGCSGSYPPHPRKDALHTCEGKGCLSVACRCVSLPEAEQPRANAASKRNESAMYEQVQLFLDHAKESCRPNQPDDHVRVCLGLLSRTW